jgi:hypothetical protein
MSPGDPRGTAISPFLNAVAEFLIDLSTALKQDGVYGSAHPIARHHRERLYAKLLSTFRLQPQIDLHFAGETILCQDHFLDRRNPIYRQLAKTVSGIGVAGVTFLQGILPQEVSAFLTALNAVRAERLAPDQARARIAATAGEALRIDFLRDLIAFTPADTVTVGAEGEVERLWKPFLLGVRASQAAEGEGPDAPAAPEDEGGAQDYAEAVIDYLKLVDRSQRERLVLRGQLAGVKLGELMGTLRPELRQQIVSSVLSSERMSPELRGTFVHLVGHEHLVEVLERLNAAGRSLPAGIAGTVALLSLAKPQVDLPVVPTPGQASNAPAAHAVERLFEDERRNEYMPGEYERKLQDLEGWARRTARRAPEREPQAPPLSAGEAERHFLDVAQDLLTTEPEESVVEGITGHAGRAFARAFETTDRHQRQRALSILGLGQRLRRMRRPGAPLPWEQPETLDQLVTALASKDPDLADAAGAVLAAIGRPAIAALLRVFGSHDIAIRHRAFNALVAMPEDPSPDLLARLGPAEVWYVQRNVLAVLRERGEQSGLVAAKRLWPAAHPKVKVEILHYLHAAQDPEALTLWETALADRSQELSAAAARLLLRWPWPEAAARLVERVRAMPAWQVGSDHHLELLRVLARCGDGEARRYVEQLPGSLRSLPWRSNRLRGELERLLRGGEPSISN